VNTPNEDDRRRVITRRLSTTLPRILREFSRDFDRRVTHKLRERGHTAISLSHQIAFSNLGLGSTRVTELADRAQITQQAMGKTLKELENLGYLQRSVDATDRRARAISMTEKGLQLVEDAVEVIEEIRGEYAAKIGARELEELDTRLREAASKLELDYLPRLWAEARD
jgi:DNA-binding MarR family transcriptional regulator